MYQKGYVGNTRYLYLNNERKEDIFAVLCKLHNINQEKKHISMFILLLDTPWQHQQGKRQDS